MKYYKAYPHSDKLTCLLCKHYCLLKDEEVGICGVNKNIDNKIVNLVHSKVAAINIDPVEKKPLYHFLPTSTSLSFGTVGCNFKCPFCQNWGISQEKNIEKNSNNMTPLQIVQTAIKHNSKSISYTYNEPTIFYPFIKDVATLAHKHNIKNILVTNGFESTQVIEDMKDLIDGANIDLKSFDKEYYKKDLGGTLVGVKDTIIQMKKVGIWVEVTTLIVPTKNSSTKEIEKIANFLVGIDKNIPWHISAFHPDFKEKNLPSTSMDMLLNAYNIGLKAGLNYIYIGNRGLENSTFCTNCGELLIYRSGFKAKIENLKNSKCKKCNKILEGIYE